MVTVRPVCGFFLVIGFHLPSYYRLSSSFEDTVNGCFSDPIHAPFGELDRFDQTVLNIASHCCGINPQGASCFCNGQQVWLLFRLLLFPCWHACLLAIAEACML